MSVVAPPRPPRHEPDDLDALIEEARRRARRRRWGYGLAALVLAVAGAGLYFGSNDGGDGQPATRVHHGDGDQAAEAQRIATVRGRPIIVEAGLTAPDQGWAANGLGLWWTSDGGRTWRAIAPPEVRSTGDIVARVVDIDALGDRYLWVSAADIRSGGAMMSAASRHMAIERSRDGGKTWRSTIPPGCEFDCAGAYLSFVDTRHGFALTRARVGSRLFATSDGGRSWRRVSSDVAFAGPIRFTNARDGWGVSEPSGNPTRGGVLYRTSDGGRTWRRVELPSQSGARHAPAGLPRFFDAHHGVVPVRLRDHSGAQRLVINVTHDGGETWTTRAAPQSVELPSYSWSVPEATPFAAASISDWFVFAGPTLYSTTDGGRTWAAAKTVAPHGPHISDVGFSTRKDGWAIFGGVRGHRNAPPALVATHDGGRHWAPLKPGR